jgi:hypothetical protein
MNFKEYWALNEELYTQLGVTKAVAYKIWCDAVDQLQKNMVDKIISKL